jgi:hypothetical protein
VLCVIVNTDDQQLRPADVSPDQNAAAAQGVEWVQGLGAQVTIPVVAVPRSVAERLLPGTTLLSLVYDREDQPPPVASLDGRASVVRAPAPETGGAHTLFLAAARAMQEPTNDSRADARAVYARAIALHPRHADAHIALGALLHSNQQHWRAQWLFAKAAEIEPSNGDHETVAEASRKRSLARWRHVHGMGL